MDVFVLNFFIQDMGGTMYPEVREELSKRVTLLASSTFVYVGSEVQTQVVRIV